MTETLYGHGASLGVALGPALRMVPPPALPAALSQPHDLEREMAAAHRALRMVAAGYQEMADRATGETSTILESQALMASDIGLADAIVEEVVSGKPATLAVVAAITAFQQALASAGDYFAQRSADLDDLKHRTLAVLLDRPMPGLPSSSEPFVLVAEDLAPADTAALADTAVIAIVTERGGPTSHTAILAKAAGLPAVVNCPAAAGITDGQRLLVDADAGTVVVDPDEDKARAAVSTARRRANAAAALSGPGCTADGHSVPLYLNLGHESGIAAASAVDAEGVGLFRTEFLFLDRTTAPSRVEQERIYGELFAGFAGRTVIVRTLDAGSDKPLAFAPNATASAEPNPALGVRGYRVRSVAPELQYVQLSAIAAAARRYDADVRVMAPMISTPDEANEFAAAVYEHGLTTAGVMIEVPAAALRAQDLLAGVEFASIGTNDLSQYTYAADRGLADLARLLDPWQPGVLELVGLAAEAGRRLGKPVGVCGEAASDPLLAPVLVGLGVTSLSMSPSALPSARAALRTHTLESCRSLATAVLAAASPAAARELVRRSSKN